LIGKNRKMKYQPEQEKIYPLHRTEFCFKSVKRVRNLTENERRVYRLNSFSNIGQNALVSDSFMEAMGFGSAVLKRKIPELWKEWEQRCERDWKKQKRLEKEKNKHKKSLWDSFYEFLKNKGKNPYLVLVGVFVPLSDCLKQSVPETIKDIDLQELKEKWNMEIVDNKLIRIKDEKELNKKLHEVIVKAKTDWEELKKQGIKKHKQTFIAERMRDFITSEKITFEELEKIRIKTKKQK